MEPSRAVDAHSWGVEAQNGAVEGLQTNGRIFPDPDPHPHQSENSDPDPHQNEKRDPDQSYADR